MPDKIETIITAKDETKAALNSATDNLKKYENAHNNAMKKGAKHRTVTRQLRAQFGQLGYQIQDVAVQMQMGTNVMMVLGQQGSQMASVFGSGGAIIGAFIAAGAAITSVLIPDLFAGGKALKDMKTNVDLLHDSFKSGAAGVGAYSHELLGKMFGFELKDAEKELKELEVKLQEARDAQRKAFSGGEQPVTFEKGFATHMLGPLVELLPVTEEVKKANEAALESARKLTVAAQGSVEVKKLEIAKLKEKMAFVKGELTAREKAKQLTEFETEALAEWINMQKAAGKAQASLVSEIDAEVAANTRSTKAFNAKGAMLRRLADPLHNHIENIKEYKTQLDANNISQTDFAKLVINSGKALNKLGTYTAEQRKAVEAIRDAQDPLRAHNRYVKELKLLVKDAGLTEQEFAAAVKASHDALMEKNEALDPQLAMLDAISEAVDDVPWSTYTADQLEAVKAIRDAQDPLRAHNRYVEELKVLVKDAGLSEQAFATAVNASRAATEAMIDAQDPQLAMLDAISEAVDDVPWSTYTADQLKAVEAIRDAQDPMRAHNRYVEELKVLVKDAGLTEQEFTLAVQASRDALMEKNEVLEESQTLLQEYADEASNVNDRLQEVATGGVRSLENSLLDLAKGTKSAAEAFKSMANSIVDDITRMAIKQQITGPLSGMLNTAIGSMFTPATGFNGAFGDDMSFAGGGFTGRGARSGGVDGKGGFPAVLHPNETVVDHTKGQQTGGASVVQNFNITTGVQQTVRAEIMNMMPQIAEAAKAAVADGKQRGGSYSAAFA